MILVESFSLSFSPFFFPPFICQGQAGCSSPTPTSSTPLPSALSRYYSLTTPWSLCRGPPPRRVQVLPLPNPGLEFAHGDKDKPVILREKGERERDRPVGGTRCDAWRPGDRECRGRVATPVAPNGGSWRLLTPSGPLFSCTTLVQIASIPVLRFVRSPRVSSTFDSSLWHCSPDSPALPSNSLPLIAISLPLSVLSCSVVCSAKFVEFSAIHVLNMP